MEFIVTLFAAFILVFGFVKPVVADSRYIGSGSMAPTLKVGHGPLQKDRVLVNKLAYEFGEQERGDIVLFESVEGGEDDTVELRRAPLPERRASGGAVLPEDARRRVAVRSPPEIVPDGHVFVMGDHRTLSHDSRFFRPAPEEKLIGEATLLYWPVGRAGRIQ